MNKSRFSQLVNGRSFNKFCSLFGMFSKYGIAILVITMLHAWSYIPFLLFVALACTAIGFIFRVWLKANYIWVKYFIIPIEWLLFAWVIGVMPFIHLMLQPLPLILTVPLFGNFAGELVRSHYRKQGKEFRPHSFVGKVFNYTILSEEMFGVERLGKIGVSAYYSFVFGLQSIFNEAIVLGSFVAIGCAEVEPDKLWHTCKHHCSTVYRVVIRRRQVVTFVEYSVTRKLNED